MEKKRMTTLSKNGKITLETLLIMCFLVDAKSKSHSIMMVC